MSLMPTLSRPSSCHPCRDIEPLLTGPSRLDTKSSSDLSENRLAGCWAESVMLRCTSKWLSLAVKERLKNRLVENRDTTASPITPRHQWRSRHGHITKKITSFNAVQCLQLARSEFYVISRLFYGRFWFANLLEFSCSYIELLSDGRDSIPLPDSCGL